MESNFNYELTRAIIFITRIKILLYKLLSLKIDTKFKVKVTVKA